jgi:hypothetical protein
LTKFCLFLGELLYLLAVAQLFGFELFFKKIYFLGLLFQLLLEASLDSELKCCHPPVSTLGGL